MAAPQHSHSSEEVRRTTLLLSAIRLSSLALLFFAVSVSSIGVRGAQVLVLYDERTDMAGLAMFDAGFSQEVRAASRERVEIFREPMDLSRFDSPAYRAALREFLRAKYAEKKIDVAVAVMQPALDFLLESTNAILSSVPIVFCGIDRTKAESQKFPPRVTGILLKREFAPTLRLASKIHPDTKRIAVVAGTSEFDRQLLDQARAEFAPFESRFKFTYYTKQPLGEVLAELSRLPPRTLVLYTTMFRDGAGKACVPHEVAERISASANAPVYGFLDQYVGHGIVGGRLYSLGTHGEAAARLVTQILHGKSPAEIPPREPDTSVTQFDWRQMERWKIKESQLPSEGVIRFRPPSFWREHGRLVLVAAALILVQAWVIGGLILHRARTRRAEDKLVESEKSMNLAADAAHLGLVVWNTSEARMWTSANWKEIHGYRSDDEVRFEELLQRIHPEDREMVERKVKDALQKTGPFVVQHRVILPGGRLRWIAKSGRVEPVANNGHVRLVGVAMDITERMEAEEAAREVSGKLITAQEDERRRIARDLHDDLNQRLALLSVEADLLGQMEQQPSARPLIQDIASQIRSLSSEIHKLSYQLHPAKLEQLGLVSATRALCNEEVKVARTVIEFVHSGVPRDLNKAAALCLFRIVQECLKNIGRHSHATQARVELMRKGGEVMLTVSDNGDGFDMATVARHAGLGLVGMRERVRLVNGHISFSSERGKGTQVEVRVPIAAKG